MSDKRPTHPHLRRLLVGLTLAALLVAFILLRPADRFAWLSGKKRQSLLSAPPPLPAAAQSKPPGDDILSSYGQPTSRPEDDLGMMAHAFSNLTLLVKGEDAFRMGANEEFAAALRGKNRDSLRFVSDEHSCFNANGQIVDRWRSPLFFHVRDRSRVDIRSAGPDHEMWTEDDLHRMHDGQFHRGKDLPNERARP